MIRALLACLVLIALDDAAAVEEPIPTTGAAQAALRSADSALLSADSGGAIRALRSVPAAEFAGDDAAHRECVLGRLGAVATVHVTAGIDDTWVRNVLASYQDYWWRAMATPRDRDALEATLLEELKGLLGTRAAGAKDFETLDAHLTAELEKRGYHSLRGRTAPLLELMLWRTQESRDYDVALPEGPQRVVVEILDDFVSGGWNDYANCGKSGTGGWVGEDRLFAVRGRYKSLEGENFRVTYLGHEAQHFADKRRFPGLADWELEYRAKLVELSMAEETRETLLRRFTAAQSDDRGSPHAYANKRVIAELTEALGADPLSAAPERLRQAARSVLIEDSHQRMVNR